MRAAQQEKCIECSMDNASMYLFCGVKGVSGRVSGKVSVGFPWVSGGFRRPGQPKRA